jgi:hypothetical protein
MMKDAFNRRDICVALQRHFCNNSGTADRHDQHPYAAQIYGIYYKILKDNFQLDFIQHESVRICVTNL